MASPERLLALALVLGACMLVLEYRTHYAARYIGAYLLRHGVRAAESGRWASGGRRRAKRVLPTTTPTRGLRVLLPI